MTLLCNCTFCVLIFLYFSPGVTELFSHETSEINWSVYPLDSHRVPIRLDLRLGPTTEFFGKASVESQRKEPWPTTLSVGPNMADVARPTTKQSSAAHCKSCARSWSWEEQSHWIGSRSVTEMLTDCVPGWGRHLWKVNISNSASEFSLNFSSTADVWHQMLHLGCNGMIMIRVSENIIYNDS